MKERKKDYVRVVFRAHTSSMLEVTTGESRLRRVMTVMGERQ
jgi:hypothetical protein